MRTKAVLVLFGVFTVEVGRAYAQPSEQQPGATAPQIEGQQVPVPATEPTAPIPTSSPTPGQPPITAAPAPIAPGPPPTPTLVQPVPQTRERAGLFLSGDLALAGHASGRDNITVSGGGLGLRLAAGAMLTPRFALFGGISYFESASVTVELDGMTAESDAFTLSATSLFFGGRIYTDSDFYFEGSLGSLKQGFKEDASGIGGTSDVGVIGHLGIGKEWRMGSGLTLGLGARLGVGAVPARDGGDSLTVGHFDLCIALGYSGG
jgi:hypothetical protein